MAMGKHKAMQQWLAIMFGCLMLSGVIMVWQPGVTGFAVLDAGPAVELNPEVVGWDNLYSNLSVALVIVLFLIAVQVAVYFFVTRIYKDEEA